MTGLRYPIPKGSEEAWRRHRGKEPHNPGLIFDRFVPESGEMRDKKQAWSDILAPMSRPDPHLFQAWKDRWEAAVQGARADRFCLKTQWRLVVGLGRTGPLEAGFTFCRYGFPLLPGSSLKGVARTYSLITVARAAGTCELAELEGVLTTAKTEEELEKVLRSQYTGASDKALSLATRFRAVFGTTLEAGGAVFFDAIPARPPQLELDVMNPHYREYYLDKEPPANWLTPVPVYFLTVASGTEFLFAIGWRRPPGGGELLNQAREWLVAGLENLGVGAKTATGYGYFTS